jgi:hypothetical protein
LIGPSFLPQPLSAPKIESRIASLLPGLLLARIDGKSPVEYITDDRDKRMASGR